MQIITDRNASRAGMTAVEMALILPLFFVLLMGMFDVGRWCWARNVVQDAADVLLSYGDRHAEAAAVAVAFARKNLRDQDIPASALQSRTVVFSRMGPKPVQ
ncbi:TadE family protein [Salidesulfovibrio brasiliensis]|uniref:TadE family protein n=1 Tax=Salidesulfovibrio brasiliensis TaxID=221711 RepID=UPI0006D27F5A|nr:TadE family protein [Salidesulfovibrio brasiliensis]